MKKFIQTITFSLFFATLGFAQFQVTESNGGTANLDGDKAEWIHWDDGENANTIGVGEAGTWYGFARFETADLAAYDGLTLSKVRTYLGHEPTTASVVVWTGAEGDFTEVVNQEIIPAEYAWVEADLTNPVVIDASVELWIGIAVGDPGDGFFPLGCDATTDADGKGNLVTFDGVVFEALSDYGIDGDWNIQGFIEASGEPYTVTFNLDMTDAVIGEGGDQIVFDPLIHDVYISGDFNIWAEPGSDENYKLNATIETTTIFHENFNDGVLPTGWLNLDEDGDGHSWFLASADYGIIDGDYAIASASYDYDEGPLTPDNWLITPQITGVGENYVLSFYRKAQDPNWAEENYDVLISTTGTSPTDFTSIYNETLTDGEWEQISIALADYAGEDIYIAFRHHAITDMFVLVLDAIQIVITEDPGPEGNIYTINLNAEEVETQYKYFLVENNTPTWALAEWVGEPYRSVEITQGAVFNDIWGKINDNEEPNEDATLSDLTIDGITVDGFDPLVYSYFVELPLETTDVPVVGATTNDINAYLNITQAEGLPGTAEILVTAEDETTQRTYYVIFTFEDEPPSNDASLSNITIEGASLSIFDPNTFEYSLLLPEGTTDIPVVDATPNDENANVYITQAQGLPGEATIDVTAEDNETSNTYTIAFSVQTSISETLYNNVELFPNPAYNKITIKSEEIIEKVQIYNVNGQLIKNISAGSNNITINVNKINPGFYIIKLFTKDGVITKKVQILN